MLFNSIEFLLFFPVVTVGYFLLRSRARWAWLLAASCFFYMAFVPAYILVLGGTIAVDYVAGILIESAPPTRKRRYLALSLCANLGILAIFKYANFAIDNANVALRLIGAGAWQVSFLHIVLPIGLSFHTFQAMAYTIEVYRGRQAAERNFGIYALYVMFYPQLVAGPIERPQNVLPQLKEEHRFDYGDVTNGLKLMAWGFFQKVVVADRLARIVSPVFDHVTEHHGLLLAIASVAFAFEIYFDFAGYSDIALGAAQVMGVRLMVNFRRPYYSKSISEFWTRWHISLSTWFRDYVYVPLGGNRVSRPRWYGNLMIVFLLSGLWHGANWTFLVWGGLNGLYLIGALVLDPLMPRALKDNTRFAVRLWNVVSVFLLATIAFVFFRAKTVADGVFVLRHIPTGFLADLSLLAHRDLHGLIGGRGFPPPKEWVIAGAGLFAIQLVHLAQRTGSVRDKLAARPAWMRWPVYVGLVYIPLFFASSEPVQFIYFQF